MIRVLIDEDIDVGLRHHLGESVLVETVQYRGWKGIRNGELLGLAEKHFDVFVTMDDNLPSQQNLAMFRLAVVILRARSKRLVDLLECVPSLKTELVAPKPGSAIRIYPAGE
jgi:hypothetical protein